MGVILGAETMVNRQIAVDEGDLFWEAELVSFTIRRGAFVMKGAREQRLLWLPRSSAATLCGKQHVVGFCTLNFTPN